MMSRKLGILSSALLVIGLMSTAHANSRHKHKHYYPVVRSIPPHYNAFGGRLVYHPALNIACDDMDRAYRAIPCNQPVWVYGSPCEIDLGQGASRPCDERRFFLDDAAR